ncbi:gas vesicle protein K [Amycolatopsis sp. NPDC051128]|uniref:gas vesicle protein K n=1 Tax=Amycolatopsis sp. NPDC051128 TaxID=3155412 RepID=UPI00342D82FF
MSEPVRIAADAGRGLGHLVITVLDILKEVLERQALRRLDAGTLTPDQVERLGQALIGLELRFAEIRAALDDIPSDIPADILATEGRRPL